MADVTDDISITVDESQVAQPPAPQAPPTPNPLETRINELVAKQEEEKRFWAQQLEESRRTQTEMMRLLAETRAQPTHEPAPPALPEDLDPRVAQYMQYVARQQVNPEIAALKARQQQYEAEFARMRWESVASQEKDPEVLKTAQALLDSWRRDPEKRGWVEADALTHAVGIVAQRQRAAQAGERRFGAGYTEPVVTGHAPPPPVQTPSRNAIPANIDDLPLEQQIAIYEKAIGNEPL